MSQYKKIAHVASHLGLCLWILYTAFEGHRYSNQTLLWNYSICAVLAFLLLRTKIGPGNNV